VATRAVKAGIRAALPMPLEQGLRYENEVHTICMSDNTRRGCGACHPRGVTRRRR
jgi:enoyl-CoA hydratase